jgi:hypothetical protein
LAFVASAFACVQVSNRSRSVPIASMGTVRPKYSPPGWWHSAQLAAQTALPCSASPASTGTG